MEESEVKDGSILQFDQAKVGGTRVVTGAMLIAKNTNSATPHAGTAK